MNNSTENCSLNYVEVKDGSEENSTLLGRFCGPDQAPHLMSTKNKVVIKVAIEAASAQREIKGSYEQGKLGLRAMSKTRVFIVPCNPAVAARGTFIGKGSRRYCPRASPNF